MDLPQEEHLPRAGERVLRGRARDRTGSGDALPETVHEPGKAREER